jgi:MATE family multidrug resistance protein
MMWVSLITLWGIALPLGYALGKFTILGAFGIWYGMMAGVGISIMFLLFRLASKKKNYLENWT